MRTSKTYIRHPCNNLRPLIYFAIAERGFLRPKWRFHNIIQNKTLLKRAILRILFYKSLWNSALGRCHFDEKHFRTFVKGPGDVGRINVFHLYYKIIRYLGNMGSWYIVVQTSYTTIYSWINSLNFPKYVLPNTIKYEHNN